MKNEVKAAIAFFRVMIEHTQKGYEPSPPHILKRMIRPLCSELAKIEQRGTKNDAWDFVEGLSAECRRLR
ncbi:MAG: hypothetical protein QME81_09315 [bacterium]|nr:hypothetical protein [bacterium]